jgi:transcriptional regulator with XRE-family HTH domain
MTHTDFEKTLAFTPSPASSTLQASAFQAAAPIALALAECDEELREEAVELFKQLASGELDKEQCLATTALLGEILFPYTDGSESPVQDLADADEAEQRVNSDARKTEARMDQEEATFAVRLREFMEKQGITQEQLAEKMGVGQPAISMMLQRNCRPQKRTVQRLAEALAVTAEELWPTQWSNEAHNRIREFTDAEENKPMSRIAHVLDAKNEDEHLFTVSTIAGDSGGGGGGGSGSVEEFAEHYKNFLPMTGNDAEQISIDGDRVIWKGKKAVAIITTLRGKIAVYTLTDSGFSLNEPLTSFYNDPSEN